MGENFRVGSPPVVPAKKSYALKDGSAPSGPEPIPTSISPLDVCCRETPLEPIPDAASVSDFFISSFSLRILARCLASSSSRRRRAWASSLDKDIEEVAEKAECVESALGDLDLDL